MVVLDEGRELVHFVGFDVDHLQQQQRVMRGQRAPGLADQMRHRELVLPARFGDRVDDVVGVFLQRVVDARVGRRVRAVVIHAQAAADVDVRDVEPHLAQLDVEARDLLQPDLDEADVGDLRAEMEVNQLDPIELVRGAQLVDGGHEVGGIETELGLLAAALLPPAEAARRELDADARGRRDAQLLRDLEQHVDLAQLLDDDEDLMAELLAHEREAHELFVLVAVADDQMVGVLGEPQHRLQLRLAAALEADAVLRAEFDDLFDDVPLLVDLDRVDGRVAAVIRELLTRVVKSQRQRVEPGPQDVREAQQHRELDTLLLEIVRQLIEIQLAIRMVGVGPNHDVATVVQVEESGAPPVDVVERLRRLGRPRRGRLGRYGFGVRGHWSESKTKMR